MKYIGKYLSVEILLTRECSYRVTIHLRQYSQNCNFSLQFFIKTFFFFEYKVKILCFCYKYENSIWCCKKYHKKNKKRILI